TEAGGEFQPEGGGVGGFEPVAEAQRLRVGLEAAVPGHELAQLLSPRVAERRMADVVAERDRLDERLVQSQRPADRARDLRDLERVGHARAVVVAGAVDEDLRLVIEAAESAAGGGAVADGREVAAVRGWRLRVLAAAARARDQRVGGEVAPFELFGVRARPLHAAILGQAARKIQSARSAARAALTGTRRRTDSRGRPCRPG